uniref:MOSC domain-containing protein n=1 Tax=Moniliophthora roreri TaxID=221103 RepID=A0A0W0G9P3_MONRR
MNSDVFSTCAFGLITLFFVLGFPLSSLRKRLKKTPQALSNQDVVRAVGKHVGLDKSRLNEPNFGYGDVRVSKLLIHPIKSCRATSVKSCHYTPDGLEFQRFCSTTHSPNWIALTSIVVRQMVLITPKVILDEASPHGGELSISFPEESKCETFSIPLQPNEDILRTWSLINDVSMWGISINGYICETIKGPSASAILSRYFGKSVHLVFKGTNPRPCKPTDSYPNLKASARYQDGYPLLILSQENVEVLEKEVRSRIGQQGIEEKWTTEKLAVERFRPNVVLSGAGAFAEDYWDEIAIGADMQAASGAPGILVVSKCARCLLPNVSPQTGIRDQAVPYKVLMKTRLRVDSKNRWKPCCGCNSVPLGEGLITVGDAVLVRKLVI